MKSYNETYCLLKLISSHLSSRNAFNKLEYSVEISDNKDVSVHPVVLVFPNVHDRKPTDKEFIMYHILKHHIKNVEDWKRNLIPGRYIYRLDVKRQRRTWMRIIYDESNKVAAEIKVTDK